MHLKLLAFALAITEASQNVFFYSLIICFKFKLAQKPVEASPKQKGA